MATAEEILPIERLRRELGVPEGDTATDSLLVNNRLAAIRSVERITNTGLVDGTVEITARRCNDLLRFKYEGVSAVTGVTYVDCSTFTSTTVTNGRAVHDGLAWYIRTNDGSAWPNALNDSYVVAATVGVSAGDLDSYGDLVAAIVLTARQLYHGQGISPKENQAVGLLVHTYREVVH